MELIIYSPSEDGFVSEIKWNHEQIKKEVSEKVSLYKNLVYTDEQIKEAKSDRAKLNKFIKTMEDKRKEVKKQCLKPYEDFEKKMKEINAIVNEPILLIDEQLKAFDDKKKAEKMEQIVSCFCGVSAPEWLELEMLMNPRWLNATFSINKVMEEMASIVNNIEKDIKTIENLPEYSFEALEVYKHTLNLVDAINEGQRLYNIQKAKEKTLAQPQVVEEEPHVEDVVEEINDAIDDAFDEEELQKKEWVSFKALLSYDDALKLASFFKEHDIEFESI